jgi:type IX secretion system PorP/SprF family membrane protein
VKKFVLICLVVISSALQAQQDALFTQYMYNKLEFNPAYAGSGEGLALNMIYRLQWVGIKGAPRTLSFTAHTPLRNPHIGLGFSAYSDVLGPSVDYNVMGTFAYRIIFSASKLCFGVSGGIKYFDIDWNQLNPKDAGDLELTSQVKNKVVPDADFGIYYYASRYYLGVSSKHLLENQVDVSTSTVDGTLNFTRLLRHFYFMAGGVLPLTKDIVFTPSLLLKYVQNAPLQLDINGSFVFNGLLTLGASYRTDNAIGLLVEINLPKGFAIGYSYDIWFNALEATNQGSHEIRLGYDFDLFGKNRMLSPRYF